MHSRVLNLMLSVVILLSSGCSSVYFANHRQLPKKIPATCQRLDIVPTKYVLTVNIGSQKALLFEDGWKVKTYSCSTSRVGIGETNGSYCTPRGLHRIAEKVGDGQPAGTIFKNRAVVGYVSKLGVKAGSITTRIMWLDGLEPGFNRGGNVDTHDREIYIHGTGDQQSLGKPASIGCIHLADPDLIALYDLLPSGTLVWISEK